MLEQWRGTQRYEPLQRNDEDALTRAIVTLASKYGRYGYRRITALLRSAGWQVGKDRVQCIWRREGLKVPAKQRPRGRLWLEDGSCVRLRPEHVNHVWSYDFVSAVTHDGRTLRILVLIDEYTRECLALRVERRLNSFDVIDTLAEVMLRRGIPEHIRSDNGPEFIARELQKWLANVGTRTLYIERGSPCQCAALAPEQEVRKRLAPPWHLVDAPKHSFDLTVLGAEIPALDGGEDVALEHDLAPPTPVQHARRPSLSHTFL